MRIRGRQRLPEECEYRVGASALSTLTTLKDQTSACQCQRGTADLEPGEQVQHVAFASLQLSLAAERLLSCLGDAASARSDHWSLLGQVARSIGNATRQSAARCGWQTCFQHSASSQKIEGLRPPSQTHSCAGGRLHFCTVILHVLHANVYAKQQKCRLHTSCHDVGTSCGACCPDRSGYGAI